MIDPHVLHALTPVILLLGLGVLAIVGSRGLGLSPIVGYLLLGLLLKASGLGLFNDSDTVALLAELGVVFLLFDIGLHFSLAHVREQARDIFGFGPVQVLAGTALLGGVALLFGLAPGPAFLVGAILALSSTAVVAQLIAERHQQNCPVGLTATAILIFQDVAAIFLLIVAGALGQGTAAMLPAMGDGALEGGPRVRRRRFVGAPRGPAGLRPRGAQPQRGSVHGHGAPRRARRRLGHRPCRPVPGRSVPFSAA